MGSHRVGHDWSDLACMHALEKGMATHSSILAWRIPGMEEPGGLPSMVSHKVGHYWSDLTAAAASVQFSSIQSLSPVWSLQPHGLELVQTQVHQVSDAIQLSHPLSSPSLPAFNLSQRWVFSNESVVCIGWTKYQSFRFSISPSNEYSGLISVLYGTQR